MICPKCSHENEEGVRFCVQCGQPLIETPPAPQPIQSVPAAAPVPSQPPAPPQPVYAPAPQTYPYPQQAAPTVQGPYPPQAAYPYPPAPQQPGYPPQQPGYPPQQPGYPPQQPGYPPQQPYGYPPQPGYPPPPYGYPQGYSGFPPPRAAVETGPWFLRSLPFLGGVLVLVGFILPWLGASNGESSGGFKNLFDFFTLLGNGVLSYATGSQTALFIGSIVAYTLVPLMGLIGLIWALTGSKKGRSAAVVCGIIGLIAQIACVFLLLGLYSTNISDVPFEQIVKVFQIGFYLSLGGFLWMIITPAFAPKSK